MIPIFFACAIIITLCIGALIAFGVFLYMKFFLKYRVKQILLENQFSFTDLIANIDTIVAVEIAIYEQYLANTENVNLSTITNTQFINIYKDLSKRIINGISPQFYECAEVYMKRAELQTYITQRVYNYLAGKIESGNDETTDIVY